MEGAEPVAETRTHRETTKGNGARGRERQGDRRTKGGGGVGGSGKRDKDEPGCPLGLSRMPGAR